MDLSESGCKSLVARMLLIEVRRAQRGNWDAIAYIRSYDACIWAKLLGLDNWERWIRELGDSQRTTK